MSERNHFNVVVVGENHAELMKKYDGSAKVEPYVVYKFSEAKNYHENKLKILKGLTERLREENMTDDVNYTYLMQEYEYCQGIDDTEFYLDLTEDMTLDEETGDALSCDNPDGKYASAQIAKNFAVPLILKDGSECFSARKRDIDWSKVHLANKEPYEIAWDTVMEGKGPTTEDEKTIYENMKNRTSYFKSFGTRENYVNSCTAFWGYAFVDNDGWTEVSEDATADWTIKFYNRFIKPLPENALITIYECIRN